MRRKDRETRDESELREILDQSKVCRVALHDAQGIYIVPLNYGYEYADGKLTLYFHSAKAGRKVDAFKAGCDAGFELDCGHKLLAPENGLGCGYSFAYKSIIGNGRVSELTDYPAKLAALSCIMRCQTGREFTFDNAALDSVCIFCLRADDFTGKHKLP